MNKIECRDVFICLGNNKIIIFAQQLLSNLLSKSLSFAGILLSKLISLFRFVILLSKLPRAPILRFCFAKILLSKTLAKFVHLLIW